MALLASLVACSAGAGAQSPDASYVNDDASDGSIDAASSDDAAPTYPAPHQAPPTVVKSSGKVLPAPKLVVVTFPGEAFASQVETLAMTLGASSYWADTTKEYGVGPVTFARSVHVQTAAPTSTADTDITTWLASQLDGTHADWGTPDASTIYTVLYPKGTKVTLQGQPTCAVAPAYHGEVSVGQGLSVPYAVVTRCDPFMGLSGIDYVTGGLSHEWVEASTNPMTDSAPAYQQPASANLPWTIRTGGELADMCTLSAGVYFKPADLPFTVQRSWSNASALAGHDPCVTAPAEPYFNAAPLMPDTVTGSFAGQKVTVTGVKVGLGKSVVVEVDLFSDADTGAPWTVGAQPFTAGTLTFSWDATQGRNGDKLQLTVTRVKDLGDWVGIAPFEIRSALGTRESFWIGAVGD